MFTGLVEAKGVLRARTARGDGGRLFVATDIGPLVVGESVAVQGVCLTVTSAVPGGFEADASAETLARSTLGTVPVGRTLNLERAVALGGRMGGHIVTGHVDDTAKLRDRRVSGETLALTFDVDSALVRFIAPKGSVCIDGVSLTVNRVVADRFDVVVIPHTLGATTLADIQAGQTANVEVDVLARYVESFLQAPAEADDRLLGKLRAAGFISP